MTSDGPTMPPLDETPQYGTPEFRREAEYLGQINVLQNEIRILQQQLANQQQLLSIVQNHNEADRILLTKIIEATLKSTT